MQEKFSDILRYARGAGKKVIAKIKKGEDMEDKNINIESYDGEDAVYSGSDEEYEEFLKSVDGKMNTSDEAEPVENTQKINLGETINIQGVIDKVKKKAVEFGEAAKSMKDDVAGKIEDFKAATANTDDEDDGETRFEKFEKTVDGIKSSLNVDEMKKQISDSVKGSMGKIGNVRDGLSSITERFDGTDEKVDEIADGIDDLTEALEGLTEKVDAVAEKLQLIEIQDMESSRERAQNNADLRHSLGNIGEDVTEIKQAVVSVSKLNDSIFDLKNAQINTKNSVSELEEGFARLKKKCVAGVTILSILSAIIIALEVVQLLS